MRLKKSLRQRICGHHSCIKDFTSLLGSHFDDHGIENFSVQIIEEIGPQRSPQSHGCRITRVPNREFHEVKNTVEYLENIWNNPTNRLHTLRVQLFALPLNKLFKLMEDA